MDQQQTPKTEYDETNLIDYIRIIIKRKWLILVFLLAGLIIAGGLTFLLPINYKAETYLEIGEYSREDVLYYTMDISSRVVDKVNGGFYGDYPGVEANDDLGEGLVEIEIISKDPEEAKKTLENINKIILDERNQKIETRRNSLENSIKELQEKIDFLLSKNKEVETLELKIFNIQEKINNTQTTKIIKEPIVVSEKKPNLAFNLTCGGILGIFLGVFLAFGKEWWEKNKKRL